MPRSAKSLLIVFQIGHVTYVILTETDFIYLIGCFLLCTFPWVHRSVLRTKKQNTITKEFKCTRIIVFRRRHHYFFPNYQKRVYCLTIPQNRTFTRAKQLIMSPSQLFVRTKLIKGTRELWKREIDQLDLLFLLDPWKKISLLRSGEETDVVNTFIHSFSIFLIISEKVDWF